MTTLRTSSTLEMARSTVQTSVKHTPESVNSGKSAPEILSWPPELTEINGNLRNMQMFDQIRAECKPILN